MRVQTRLLPPGIIRLFLSTMAVGKEPLYVTDVFDIIGYDIAVFIVESYIQLHILQNGFLQRILLRICQTTVTKRLRR